MVLLKRETADELCLALGFDSTQNPIYRTILVTAIYGLSNESKRDIIERLLRLLPENNE